MQASGHRTQRLMHVGWPPPDHAGGDANLCIAMSPKIDQFSCEARADEAWFPSLFQCLGRLSCCDYLAPFLALACGGGTTFPTNVKAALYTPP
jgi:hypothetical protein